MPVKENGKPSQTNSVITDYHQIFDIFYYLIIERYSSLSVPLTLGLEIVSK